MKNTMSRRAAVRVVCYITALVMTLGGLALKYGAESRSQGMLLNAGWSHAFGELATSVYKIDVALQKGVSATGPALASLTSEISREAALALGAVSALPYSGYELQNTTSFLSRLGDYASYLSRTESSGAGISDEDRSNMHTLSDCASQLNGCISELYGGVAEGSLSVGDALGFEMRGESVNAIGDTISSLELEFPEYPGLIYDGPFSEHIANASPKLTENAKELSADEAAEAAAKLFGLDASALVVSGEGGGSLPVYCMELDDASGTMYIDVSKAGGYVVDMMRSRETDGAGALGTDECVKAAEAFVRAAAGADMAESYHILENGIVTVNFAFSEGGVICYPDLIKVSVSTSDGAIVGFEARGFVMNHTERTLASPTVSEQDARSALGDSLEVVSSRLAVIPSPGKYEKYCYEFLCKDEKGSKLLVYVGADSGMEERVLILIENENGTLTI